MLMSQLAVTRFVRNVFLADAVVSAAAGAVMLLGGAWLQDLLQLPAWLMLSGGLTLMVYAAGVAWMSQRTRLPRSLVWAVFAINLLWAIDCSALAFSGWMSPSLFGQFFLLAQVAAVLVFAELQYVCLRRAASPGASAYA
jgi:hypothetical protein